MRWLWLGWIASTAVVFWCGWELYLNHVRFNPLLREMRRCIEKMHEAMESGDHDAFDRWNERCAELQEHTQQLLKK